MDSTAEIF